ncbi:MAG TPA: GntR family transcriptional regulator [Pseudolabrys sp.]|nr:GntR family transcriptional regulator [Pseudolabrys sp.]
MTRPQTKPIPPSPLPEADTPEPTLTAADASRFTRTDWLADVLRERILNGTYAPGERIREVQLRSEFGFSNGPIREALQAMVAEGLAERAPWHGVHVKKLDERQLLQLFQLRLALLEYSAELAARNRTDAMAAGAAVLKQHLDAGFSEIERGGQHPSFSGRLSQWLLSAAGNAMLQDVWDKTMRQTLIYVNASLMRGKGRRSKALINALIDAICAGDVAAARAAARDLTQQTLIDLGIDGTL